MDSRGRTLSLNERRLVELVFRNGQIARVDLTEATDMTAASVTRLVAGLEEMGLFQQATPKSGARGQPKRLLSLRKDNFRSIGIYLYLNRVAAVMVDFNGHVLASLQTSLDEANASNVAQTADELTKKILEDTKTRQRDFLGVGLAVPGNFGSYGTLVRAHEAFAELDGSQIHTMVTSANSWPVYLENDGTALALGEYLFGHPNLGDPMFLVHIGYGLGGGVVINGRPYRGLKGNACLPGSLFPYDQPRPTLQDLEATLQQSGIAMDAFRAMRGEDMLAVPAVERWIDRAAEQMGTAVRVISGMFDPEIIVLGGGLPAPVTEALAMRVRSIPIEGSSRGLEAAPVVATKLGDLNGPIGAASIPFFETFFPGSSVERGNSYLNGRTPRTSLDRMSEIP